MNSYELQEFGDVLEEVFNNFNVGFNFASLSVSAVILLIGIIGVIIAAVISLAVYVLEAIPVYALAKKVGRKYAWLAWVPIFGSYFRIYVLSDIPGDKPLEFFNKKFALKNRFLSFWIYLGICVFGGALITAVISFVSWIPIIGQIIATVSLLLYLVPTVATAIMEYAYLRDVLDMFKEDKKSNMTSAIVVTVLDNICTFGFARVVLLYTIMKKEPLPQPIEVEYSDI